MFALGQEITDVLISNNIVFGRTIVYHSTITVDIPFKNGIIDKLESIFYEYNFKIHFCSESNQYILKVKNE